MFLQFAKFFPGQFGRVNGEESKRSCLAFAIGGSKLTLEIWVFFAVRVDVQVFKDGQVILFVFRGGSARVRPDVDSTIYTKTTFTAPLL